MFRREQAILALSLVVLLIIGLGLLWGGKPERSFSSKVMEIFPDHLTLRYPGGEVGEYYLPRGFDYRTLRLGEVIEVRYKKDWRGKAMILSLKPLPQVESEAEGVFTLGWLKELLPTKLKLKNSKKLISFKLFPDSKLPPGLKPNDFIIVKHHSQTYRVWKVERAKPQPWDASYHEVTGNLRFYDKKNLKLLTGGGWEVFKLTAETQVPRKLEFNDAITVKYLNFKNRKQLVLAVEHTPELYEGRLISLTSKQLKVFCKIESRLFLLGPQTLLPKDLKPGNYVQVEFVRDQNEVAHALKVVKALPQVWHP